MNSWTITPEEDPETGELVITFPPEALEAVGWKEGDVLDWAMDKDGRITLTKKDEDEKGLL
jgi:bifunctional DNA-binding transcriptional regulator/antitoxin component of YhaV-PrlF toxin-antitoxin module